MPTAAVEHGAESAEPKKSLRQRRLIQSLYLLALIIAIRAIVLIPANTEGGDFTPVWDAIQKYTSGLPVYDEDYSTETPHYLYGPGATFLLSPIGLFDDESTARFVMMLLGALSILIALAAAARMIAPRFAGPLLASTVILTFLPAEPVVSTLKLTNVNGFLLLLLVLVVAASLTDVSDRQILRNGHWVSLLRWRGVMIGLALSIAVTIKPQFIVLAAIPLLSGQVMSLLIGAMCTVALFILGWLTMNTPSDYVDRLLPYIGQPRAYNNGSIDGVALSLDWSNGTTTILKILLGVATLAAVASLWRWRHSDPVMWAYCTLGVLFCGVIMISGLLQAYYSMWLLPMVLTVVSKRSPMHLTAMWLLFFVILIAPDMPADRWPPLAEVLSWRVSIAWAAIPVVTIIWALLERQRDIRTGPVSQVTTT